MGEEWRENQRHIYLDTEDKSNDGEDEGRPAATAEQCKEGERQVVGGLDARPNDLAGLINLEIIILINLVYISTGKVQGMQSSIAL